MPLIRPLDSKTASPSFGTELKGVILLLTWSRSSVRISKNCTFLMESAEG